MKCDLGEVLHRGHCVPSYFSITERDEYVDRILENNRKIGPIVWIILSVGVLAAVVSIVTYAL